ncbi:CatB-related O-acetyltransferase [Acetobacter fallax]|uniref:Antibiotic acetyltransferase n=1 Tax=Acetobacter fallax TaxID=1737473 RepID=A0ABX0KA26_9PROT|nr:CatB-related O-acetyltransferase [Acetobacter fallax]NHO33031.1 antibiotic acetyltransferase [Acetobacter fallax]NHO36601.1 antibiotic acetyltransferase [Acetobacter fallax]
MFGTNSFSMLTRHTLSWMIADKGWNIGDHTYGTPTILEAEYADLEIGRFCSIGPNVTMILGNHRADLVTTYPFKTLSHFWPAAEKGEDDHVTNGNITIGNDVWFGAGSTILSGTTIGDGAIIAADALVRGTVEPYAIVGGNPGRTIRHRFSSDIVARLLAVAWWNWPEDLLREHLPKLMSTNIEAFLELAESLDETSEPDQTGTNAVLEQSVNTTPD